MHGGAGSRPLVAGSPRPGQAVIAECFGAVHAPYRFMAIKWQPEKARLAEHRALN
jgi:hypothetical protein